MRRNVLTTGLVACALTASWPGSVLGSVPARTTLRSVERSGPAQMSSDWLWDGMRGPMTMPNGPAWIDLRPCGPVGAGDIH